MIVDALQSYKKEYIVTLHCITENSFLYNTEKLLICINLESKIILKVHL